MRVQCVTEQIKSVLVGNIMAGNDITDYSL